MLRGVTKKKGRVKAFALLFMLLTLCLAGGCRKTHQEEALLPRPSRGYVLWLGKQAMHNQATALLSEVSQSEKMWLNSAAPNRFELLLQAAPTWLSIETREFPKPAFSYLAEHVAKLPASGINGLYLGETGETSALWLETSDPKVISLEFDPGAGDAKSFEILRKNAENAGVELGSDLLGAATGLGPDFILQTRASPESSGIYAMLEIPAQYWQHLPATENEWEGLPADRHIRGIFAEDGLIPLKLARDSVPWASAGGWGITGEIAGLDGKTRRWLYRYAYSPANPVLMWADPFGQARRILSAAIIQQTGLQRQTLSGLHFEPLFGLEPEATQNTPYSLSPGLEALNDLAGQIHRYGGWAIQADPLPPQAVGQILNGDCDFCADDIIEIMALACLLGTPADDLANLYQERIRTGLDFRRLAHGFNDLASLPYAIAANMPHTIEKIRQSYPAKMPALQNLTRPMQDFLLLCRLGQPGLAFLDSRWLEMKTAADPIVNPAIANLLETRKNLRLGEGTLISVFKNAKKGLALLSSLPDGGHWLTLLNFGNEPLAFSLTLPFAPTKTKILPDPAKTCSISERKFNLTLDGTQCINVIFSRN